MTNPRAFRPSPQSKMLVTSFITAGRTYEQRFTRCHKLNCTICFPTTQPWPNTVGHGPYWYLCFHHGKGWTRIYLGKVLDTNRFILADGSIDFEAILAARERRALKIVLRKYTNSHQKKDNTNA